MVRMRPATDNTCDSSIGILDGMPAKVGFTARVRKRPAADNTDDADLTERPAKKSSKPLAKKSAGDSTHDQISAGPLAKKSAKPKAKNVSHSINGPRESLKKDQSFNSTLTSL